MSKRSLTSRVSRNTSRRAAAKKSTSRPRWKRQNRRSGSQSSGLGIVQSLIVWLLLLIVGGFVLWYIVIWGIIPKLLAVPDSRTIAILPTSPGGNVVIGQLEFDQKDSRVFVVSGEELVQLPGEYGEYKLSAVYPLLLLEGKDARYITGTINRVLGIFLDQTLGISEPLSEDPVALAEEIKASFWSQLLVKKTLSWDLLRMWYVLQSDSAVIRLKSVNELADQIRSLNGGTFATRDECRVAILNSTKTPGLAGRLADVVEKNGGIIIRLGQYSQPVADSQLLYDPAVSACAEALEQIKTLSPVPFETKEDSTVQGTFRAPVVAIIGENFD